jgi:hypothetical protein
MNASTQAQTLALAKGDQERHQRPAVAGRTPRAMLKFVPKDGFDAVEENVRKTLDAERDAELNGKVSHAEVIRGATAIIKAAHARKRKAGN